MNLGVAPPLMRVGVLIKKVHEWIEHMAIKVLSKKTNLDSRVVSGIVCCYRFCYKE